MRFLCYQLLHHHNPGSYPRRVSHAFEAQVVGSGTWVQQRCKLVPEHLEQSQARKSTTLPLTPQPSLNNRKSKPYPSKMTGYISSTPSWHGHSTEAGVPTQLGSTSTSSDGRDTDRKKTPGRCAATYSMDRHRWSKRLTYWVGLAAGPGSRTEHPFTILQTQSINPRQYLVEFGLGEPDRARSPLAQRLWQTAAQLKARGEILPDTVDRVIKLYHQNAPNRMSASPRKAVEVVPRRMLKEPKHPGKSYQTTRVDLAEMVLLEVLDEAWRKRKYNSLSTTHSLQVRYRRGGQVTESWLYNDQVKTRFGKEAMTLALDRFHELTAETVLPRWSCDEKRRDALTFQHPC